MQCSYDSRGNNVPTILLLMQERLYAQGGLKMPCGVLDRLSPEEVLQCNTEDDCAELVKHLKPTETALLNWAVDLMSDVVEHEESNKMNARNIAMVFAPSMTQVNKSLYSNLHD
ncbi:putative Rho GTPase activation protein [Helianthus debilis subsp. tardiflorus]